MELEAELEKGAHMGLVQGRDVWGLVVEERFVVEQDHAEEDAEEQEHAKKNMK